MRGDPNARLTILSEVEKTAVYGIPNFDDFQRIEFFAMTDAERSLALGRKSVLAQVYCLLQIGYFKAKQAFFQFSLDDVQTEDIAFLLQRQRVVVVRDITRVQVFDRQPLEWNSRQVW